ncbi:MAG: hypothetical protein JNK05_30300 [Myxococcales bacterium]|nr:hypothetical protein [Myxococcales bacterium]
MATPLRLSVALPIVVAGVGCYEPLRRPPGFEGGVPDVRTVDSATMDIVAPPDVQGPRDVPVVDVPNMPIDPDAACAAVSSVATVERQPVDIIWVVDNSVSMEPAIRQVTMGLNTFASRIGMRGLDYRVVMLSYRSRTNPVTVAGGQRYGVCIPQPLAGDANCGNGPRFFQSSIDIRSTQPLEQLLGTLGQTEGYRAGQERGGEPWRDFLRPTASKTIVVVTDDESRMPADEFDRWPGGVNPRSRSFTLPPGLLDASWMGLFTGYTFSALYGWGSETDPSVRCTYTGGTMPPSSGPTYTTLVSRTRGARARICDGASAWGPFFDRVATAVETTSRVSCDLAIPSVPMGMVFDNSRVNVEIATSSMTTRPGKVAGVSACGAAGGWYYDNERTPTRITLCPASCEQAQAAVRAGSTTAVRVLFGCQTIPG